MAIVIGCQTILRYLQTLPKATTVGGVLLVGGWLTLRGEATSNPEEKAIVRPWVKTSIKWQKVRRAGRKFVEIFSTNDPFVPLANAKVFKKKLGGKVIFEKNKGHFSDSDGIKKLPSALESLLKISNN